MVRGYTTIEQSRKLAEILPLESADMYYPWYIEEDGDTIESGHRITTPNVGNFTTHKVNKMILPCWSFAVLLGVIPGPDLVQNSEKTWLIRSWINSYPCSVGGYSNPVDACVEMIIKLNELNLL